LHRKAIQGQAIAPQGKAGPKQRHAKQGQHLTEQRSAIASSSKTEPLSR